MFRIRFHGRGGQGIKTASRVLGSAFFRAGYEVQDAPRYGAERRGAPISATVRANREPIWERGLLTCPDLVVVVDGTLLALPSAGVFEGMGPQSALLIDARWDGAFQTLHPDFQGRVLLLDGLDDILAEGGLPLLAVAAAGATARLSSVISRDALVEAVGHELRELPPETRDLNQRAALAAYEHMTDMVGFLQEGEPWEEDGGGEWIELTREPAHLASPTIFRPGTAARVSTGLWRTERPVIDHERCKGCWWVCATFCPDGVVSVNAEGMPVIDYEHCKGCLICHVQCPSQAIDIIPERAFGAGVTEGADTSPGGTP